MPASFPSPTDLFAPLDWLTLLNVSLTGIQLLRPVYAPDNTSLVDFTLEYINPAGLQMAGLSKQPAGTLLTCFPPARAAGVFAYYQRAFEADEPLAYKTNYQADGLDNYFQFRAQRSGERLLVSFTDSREQDRSAVEHAQRASQVRGARTAQGQQLQDVLENVPAAIATLSGPEHRFSFANARYQYLVGNRVQVGQAVAEALPEVVEQGVIELLDRVYQTGEPFLGRNVMIMLEQPPGPPHQFYYDLTYLPLRDGQGQVRGILVFAVEVTEQVRARRQTALLQAELLAGAQRRAQARQDVLQVFANAPLAVALLREPDHQLDYWNALLDQYFPGAERGRPLQQVLPALATPEVVAQLDRLYKNGETYQSEPVLLPGATPEAAPRYVIFTYQAYQESGQVAGVALFLQDVTEQALGRQQVQLLNEELTAINQELLRSNTRLTSTNADLDTFIYTASHDLKAPITNIEGLLDALRQELERAQLDTTDVAYLLQLMDGSVARFQETIAQLTGILRQQVGQLGQAPTNLARVIDDVQLDLAGSLEATQAQVLVEVTTCPTLRLAPKDLRSIVYNLLSNALKYRSLDRAPVVRIHASCDAEVAELRVQDNGLGLSKLQQERLFQLFQRLHLHIEGSGVGLYAIKKLIENAGGTIRVESKEDVGSTFIVRLPA